MTDRSEKLAKLLAEAKAAGYSQAKVAEWLECTPRALQKKLAEESPVKLVELVGLRAMLSLMRDRGQID
jgi:hypothetical protein